MVSFGNFSFLKKSSEVVELYLIVKCENGHEIHIHVDKRGNPTKIRGAVGKCCYKAVFKKCQDMKFI
jgi:hypothetical protein